MSNLKSYLPAFLGNTRLFTEVFGIGETELDILSTQLQELDQQFDLNTATWAVEVLEKQLGMVTDLNKPIAYRRSVVASKQRGTGNLDADLIKRVCDAYTNGGVLVSYDGIIHVRFSDVLGVPPNLDDLKAAVNAIKPAYLLLDYLFSYLLIRDIEQTMTLQLLQATKLNTFAGGA